MPQAPGVDACQEIKEAPKAIDKEHWKQNRGAMSCAECRRRKIKCDRMVPCSSCILRGCTTLCPDGTLTTGQGTRGDTENLQEKILFLSHRVRQLEDALAAQIIRKPANLVEDAYKYIEAFGTLALGDDGRPAGTEGESSVSANLATPSSSRNSLLGDLPGPVKHLSKTFLPASVFNNVVDLNYLVRHLPPWNRAWRLCELYLHQAPCVFGAVIKRQLLEGCLPIWYGEVSDLILLCSVALAPQPNPSCGLMQLQGKTPHDLALLFVIFCFGALMDNSLPTTPHNEEASMYCRLARAALNLEPVLDRPLSGTTIHTLALLAISEGLVSGESSIQESGRDTCSLATKLTQSGPAPHHHPDRQQLQQEQQAQRYPDHHHQPGSASSSQGGQASSSSSSQDYQYFSSSNMRHDPTAYSQHQQQVVYPPQSQEQERHPQSYTQQQGHGHPYSITASSSVRQPHHWIEFGRSYPHHQPLLQNPQYAHYHYDGGPSEEQLQQPQFHHLQETWESFSLSIGSPKPNL